MRRNGIHFFVILLVLTTVAFSDDPVRPSNVQKQRVSPKLLREALALPEMAARTQQVPAVTLDDLRRLADKLQANGDSEGDELLHRFVREHQPATKEVATYPVAYPGADDEMFNVQCDVVEVNTEDLSGHPHVEGIHCVSLAKELQTDLHRLLSAKKAKTVIDHVLIPVKAYETGRARSGGELPVPIPSSDGTIAPQFRELVTVVDASPVPMTKDRVRIQITTETSALDSNKATTTRRIQSVIDANLGETVVQTSPATVKNHRQFVLIKVTAKN